MTNFQENVYSTQIEAKAKYLKTLRARVCNTLSAIGCDKETASDVIIAVDEACQNVIRHAYGECKTGVIDLSIYKDKETLIIELVDYADPIDKQGCQPKCREELRPGGLGLHFMHQLMDSVSFEDPPTGAGNCLIMKKRLTQ